MNSGAGLARAAIGEALTWGRQFLAERDFELPDLEAQVLLAGCLGLERSRLLASDHLLLDLRQLWRFRNLIHRRARHTPSAYLIGRREFWSLDFIVDRRVFIPRPETENVVEAALEQIRPGSRVADIGTGCGNIVIAIAKESKPLESWAVDISPAALEVATMNARTHHLDDQIHFRCGDLCAPLESGPESFDVLISNPPYIPANEIDALQPEICRYEPNLALNGGTEGLFVLSRLARESCRYLRRGGWLILEIGRGQAGAVRELLTREGTFRSPEIRHDLAGIERVALAQKA